MSIKEYFTRILTDVELVATFDVYWWHKRDVENYAKELERKIEEFKEFIQDHRSQDGLHLEVKRTYGFKCPYCGYIFDHLPDLNDPCCDDMEKVMNDLKEKENESH